MSLAPEKTGIPKSGHAGASGGRTHRIVFHYTPARLWLNRSRSAEHPRPQLLRGQFHSTDDSGAGLAFIAHFNRTMAGPSMDCKAPPGLISRSAGVSVPV
jgi:hypothetical protein